MHPAFVKKAFYFPVQRILGRNVKQLIPIIKELERLSPQDLRNYQEKQLKELLLYAAQGTLYFKQIINFDIMEGLKKDPFRALELIPVMSKEDIRANLNSLCNSKFRLSWRSTSGTTGSPLHFCKDHLACSHMDAGMHAVYSWHGIDIGDRQGRIWGSSITLQGGMIQRTKDHLLNRRRLSAFGMTRDKSVVYFRKLERFRPVYFYCYPNAASLFAQHLEQTNVDGKKLGLRAIICTGEPLLSSHRDTLQKTFDCTVVNEYGTTENGILAIECEKGNMHILAQNAVLEFIKDGKRVEDGELGEILVTELHSRSIPFIRYRTGDLGRPLFLKKCSCGRTLPLMEIIEGRVDDFIIRPDGEKVYDAILAYVLKKSVRQFRATQEALTELVIEIVPDSGYSDRLESEYGTRLQQYLGPDIHVNFRKVERIEPDRSGKLRYFISKIHNSK